jgi:hypothetical protein
MIARGEGALLDDLASEFAVAFCLLVEMRTKVRELAVAAVRSNNITPKCARP